MEDDPKISLFFQKQPPTMPAEVQRHPSVLPEWPGEAPSELPRKLWKPRNQRVAFHEWASADNHHSDLQ